MIQSPILPGFNADPSICEVGDGCCIDTSTLERYWGVLTPHSRDFQNWQLLAHTLHEQIDLSGVPSSGGGPSSGGVCSPALTHCGSVIDLCYTVVHQHEPATKDTSNFLTTAKSIGWPWTPPVFVHSSGFDTSLFHDESGQKFWLNMVWDRRPGHHLFYGNAL
jgi:xylan 1,4-beta-xylosidase